MRREIDDAHRAVDGVGDVGARCRSGAIATKRGSLPTGTSASSCEASVPSALRTRITETLAFWRFTTTARLSSPVSAMLLERDWRNSSW